MGDKVYDVAEEQRAEESENMREMLEKAFKPNSNKAIVFLSPNGETRITALFAKGIAEDGEGITYEVDGRVLAPLMMQCVADGISCNVDALKKERFHDMIANAVAAAACSSTAIPGVVLAGCNTGPLLRCCQMFAATHKIEAVKSVSVKAAKNIAWRYRQATQPQKAPVEDNGLLF